ncbi:hypothetical protein SDC9_34112 [bioreactor metagenome]|uniref:Uncharacterized protein n=1 Tax=bioreactor metagenome TaxID=1076179 RepID=A0A644V9S4_9ZZZZ|nr:hypothetical protein [Methanobrevibacter sp.]MEA4957359.1 hypothetical protein [Methanobrevibacter sp.]
MVNQEREYLITFNNYSLEMKILINFNGPSRIYFTKYQKLFDNEEWSSIDSIEGDLIPLINQLDEINRTSEINEYGDFREKLNNIWENYLLERESLRLDINQEKDFDNGIKIKRTK